MFTFLRRNPLQTVRSVIVLAFVLIFIGCSGGQTDVQELTVDDFTFDGPLGSEGTTIEKIGPNHFRVTLGHAPNHPTWPNKLNFQITDNAKGNDLLLEVEFNGGQAYTFNEYFQSWSYDGEHWKPIKWERGFDVTPQRDVLVFPTFTQDQVYVGTQVPMSYETAVEHIEEWQQSEYVEVDTVGQSLEGRSMYRLEITDTESPHSRGERWVHYLANQHPGEHNSEWRLVGMVDWMLSDEAASYRERNITHVVMMMSPDAPSNGWYRTNQEGVDMNRSYRPEGADKEEQAHEAYLWQRDFEEIMDSEAPVTTAWAIHTWQGRVEPIIRTGPEFGSTLGPWTDFRDAMDEADTQDLIETLAQREGPPGYGAISWSAGPHEQYGITGVLCEGGGNFYTKQENIDSGKYLMRSIDAFYQGTRN